MRLTPAQSAALLAIGRGENMEDIYQAMRGPPWLCRLNIDRTLDALRKRGLLGRFDDELSDAGDAAFAALDAARGGTK